MTRELQTTPEMCQHELAMYSQMERAMTADAWLAMDAAAAHELLHILRNLVYAYDGSDEPARQAKAWEAAKQWVTP